MTQLLLTTLTALLASGTTLWVTQASKALDRKRERYANAVSTLVAWAEFPYRVRRRTADDPPEIGALASMGHDIQERLAGHQAWMGSENAKVAKVYQEATKTLRSLVGVALREAWEMPAASTPAAMNLGKWGPAKDCEKPISDVTEAIAARFKLRLWRPGLDQLRHKRE